jgi:hypothetical protein
MSENLIKMKILFAAACTFLAAMPSAAQLVQINPGGDSTKVVSLEGYVDVYFGFDFNQPKNENRPYFVSYNRHNEVNLNLAYISLKYSSERARAVFTPGFGTYMNANYAAERLTLQNVVEANAGVKIFKNKGIWLDAGVLGAPYTTESAVAFDQLLYTRTFGAEYSPYYLTGGRLTLPLSKKINLYLYAINGWQVIEAAKSPLSFASALEVKPGPKLTFNWSTYYGSEESSSFPNYRGRYFTDLYCIYLPTEKLTLAMDLYGGIQAFTDTTQKQNPAEWGQGNLNVKYAFDKTNALSGRYEYYTDEQSVFIKPITGVSGFDCSSFSLCYTRSITTNVMFRVEGQYFTSGKAIFYNRNLKAVSTDALLIGGLIAKF